MQVSFKTVKTLQVPFCYYPDAVGGTEVYVELLVSELAKRGVESIVAAPDKVNRDYEYAGIRVRRFACSSDFKDLRVLYGKRDAFAADRFDRLLEEEKPDLVHLHAFTSAVSPLLAEKVKRRKIPLVFTYHTPMVSCQRGTLLRWGKEVCEGRVKVNPCAACTLNGLGLPRPLAKLMGRIRFFNARLSGPGWTALSMNSLVSEHEKSFRQIMDAADSVVAVSQWVKELLIANDVPAKKIILSRQGIILRDERKNSTPFKLGKPLRSIFLGRLDPVKGVDLLLKAFKGIAHDSMTLDIYGIIQNVNPYTGKIKNLAARDGRVKLRQPVEQKKIIGLLQTYDLLLVPSQWLESGPLVILEAFAAGIPVVGSRLGGIEELVRHEIDGLLVSPASSVEAWQAALNRVAREGGLLDRLRRGVRTEVRSLNAVANDMQALYSSLVQLRK